MYEEIERSGSNRKDPHTNAIKERLGNIGSVE